MIDIGPKKSKIDSFQELLKHDIKRGVLKPGMKIASLNDFVNVHEFSKGTIRNAVRQLREDGFIHVKDRSGMYVAAQPPCLRRYGLVLLNQRRISENNLFQQTILQQFHWLADEFKELFSFTVYHCDPNNPECPERARLEYDLRQLRLAGIIWVAHSPEDELPELLNLELTAPDVAIFRDAGVSVSIDLAHFWEKALDVLHHRGCRRIAALCQNNSKQYPQIVERFTRYSPSYWMQPLHREDSWAAKDLMRLLFDYPPEQRPDGLIVGDDHYMDGVLSMFLENGIVPERDVKIVLYTNFPASARHLYPLELIGYDVRELLYRSFRLLRSGGNHEVVDVICGAEVGDEKKWKKQFSTLLQENSEPIPVTPL